MHAYFDFLKRLKKIALKKKERKRKNILIFCNKDIDLLFEGNVVK